MFQSELIGIVIDGTEQTIVHHVNNDISSVTWSHCTVTKLVGVSPAGLVMYIGDSCRGGYPCSKNSLHKKYLLPDVY